jgi:hypothetical protein
MWMLNHLIFIILKKKNYIKIKIGAADLIKLSKDNK